MSFTDATVVDSIGAGRFQRVTLRPEDPAALAVPAVSDAAIGVCLPGGELRTYTVRHHDGDVITVDVLRHTAGPGTGWARQVRAGDHVGLDHANSWYQPPADTRWQLLACDLAGMPALARIVESLPSNATATAVVEVPDAADLDYLPTRPGVDVIPVIGTGNGTAPSRLAHAVETIAPPGDGGYCWFGGEAAQARAVRKHVRGHGWTIDQTDISGYWRSNAAAWEQRYAPVAGELFAVYQRARADGMSIRAAQEVYDEALERQGL